MDLFDIVGLREVHDVSKRCPASPSPLRAVDLHPQPCCSCSRHIFLCVWLVMSHEDNVRTIRSNSANRRHMNPVIIPHASSENPGTVTARNLCNVKSVGSE